jgi:hypothetical protein
MNGWIDEVHEALVFGEPASYPNVAEAMWLTPVLSDRIEAEPFEGSLCLEKDFRIGVCDSKDVT